MENSYGKSRKITEWNYEVITKLYAYPDITKSRDGPRKTANDIVRPFDPLQWKRNSITKPRTYSASPLAAR